jgi:ankyrin repeat protein
VVELLVNYSADISVQGGYYGTALQAAVAGGHKEVVDLLIASIPVTV